MMGSVKFGAGFDITVCDMWRRDLLRRYACMHICLMDFRRVLDSILMFWYFSHADKKLVLGVDF